MEFFFLDVLSRLSAKRCFCPSRAQSARINGDCDMCTRMVP